MVQLGEEGEESDEEKEENKRFDSYRHVSSSAVSRLLEAEKDLEAFPGMQHHREVVLARLMTVLGEARREAHKEGKAGGQDGGDGEYASLVATAPISWVLAYLADGFARHYDLAEALLYDVFVKATMDEEDEEGSAATIALYDSLFSSLVHRLFAKKFDSKDRLLTHLYLMAPRVTAKAIELLADCCKDAKNPRYYYNY